MLEAITFLVVAFIYVICFFTLLRLAFGPKRRRYLQPYVTKKHREAMARTLASLTGAN